MAHPKRPELKLGGSMSENFKNFEMRFHDYCIQADLRDLTKDESTNPDDYHKSPQLEISALRSGLPDEALQVIRYTIEPQIPDGDKIKPWVWMEKLRLHYTGSVGTSMMADRFQFWNMSQKPQHSVQDWEVQVRQAGSLCEYGTVNDELCRDKFVFGLYDETMRTELLKTHLKADGAKKRLPDVVTEAKAMESAQKANRLIVDAAKGIDEQVNWTRSSTNKPHKLMKLKRTPGTCHWCGDTCGSHAWASCPANGKTCNKCGGNDHFAIVCLEGSTQQGQQRQQQWGHGQGRGTRGRQVRRRGNGGRFQPAHPNPDREVHQLHYAEDHSHEQSADHYYDGYQCYSLGAQYINQLGHKTPGKRYFVHLPISATGAQYTAVQFQIDTAATCNTIADSMLAQLQPGVKIKHSPYLLFPYGDSDPIRPIGQVDLLCEREHKYELLKFQVLPGEMLKNKPALLSGADSEKLGLIQIKADEVFSMSSIVQNTSDGACDTPPGYRLGKHSVLQGSHSPLDLDDITRYGKAQEDKASDLHCGHMEQIHSIMDTQNVCRPTPAPTTKPIQIPQSRCLPPPGKLEKDHVLKEYPQNFSGMGHLGPPVKFKLKEDMLPVQMPIHRVPVAKREKEKAALQKYVEAGIIAKVEEPTPWCSNELIRETPKKFRICIDPSQTINKAILRPVYQMPTLNEQLHKLYNAKCLSLVDVKDGFLHCPLDEESSMMTTMHTSYGRYRWLRLPFGITSAPEEFQMRLATALEGLEGIITVADDILVFGEGNTYEEAEKDHDRRFIALMECCTEKGIKLNIDKLQFKLKEVMFMGNIITDQGMKPDPGKLSAVTQMPPPSNKAGLMRFIGMANYLSPYCKNLSAVIQPLRMLTHEDAAYIWSQIQQEAFDKAKQLIASAPVLMYYDLRKPVTLQVDASDGGLGGALLQPNEDGKLQPVAFTSCSLSPTEQRYSQIEKECLAICNCFHKFDHWLYGKADIEVHTDHQPLETILQKPLNKAPARLQKMMMRLQRYRFQVKYKKGSSMHLADTLSRAALSTKVGAKVSGFEVFRIEMEAEYTGMNYRLMPDTEIQLRQEIQKDAILSKLCTTIIQGWPDDKQELDETLSPFWTYRDELSAQNGIIYKGAQVMVPPSMYTDMLKKIHANHFGAESNTRMAREVLFWPGMAKAIQDMCHACSKCAQYGSTAPKEPMKSLPIPTLPWQLISQDLFNFEGESFLVTVCHFSDWIEVDKLENTLSATIVNKTKSHFARFGIPEICHTDNGPQFISKEYVDFATNYGFKHTTSSPYHSQGNGRAEAAVKVAKGMLHKATHFELAMLNYRNTPPQGHTYTPAQRLLCHRTRTTLPTSNHLLAPQAINIDIVVQEIKKKRGVSKFQYDKAAGAAHDLLDIGTHVYAKPPPQHHGKSWIYGKIIHNTNPRSYTIQTPNSKIRRNRVHVRPAAPPALRQDHPTARVAPVSYPVGNTPIATLGVEPNKINRTPCLQQNSRGPEPVNKHMHHSGDCNIDTVENLQPSPTQDPPVKASYVTRSGRVSIPRKILDL